MRIFFARHGQTDWNLLKKVQGTTDIPFEQSHTIDVENAKPLEFSMSELQEIRKKT